VSSGTETGAWRSVRVASPNCPVPFQPHASTVPSASTAGCATSPLTRSAPRKRPRASPAGGDRSSCLLGLGYRSRAVAAAREAIRLAPALDSPYLVLVDAELSRRHMTEAAAAASKTLELAPHAPAAQRPRARGAGPAPHT
jgi:hypothetical protein